MDVQVKSPELDGGLEECVFNAEPDLGIGANWAEFPVQTGASFNNQHCSGESSYALTKKSDSCCLSDAHVEIVNVKDRPVEDDFAGGREFGRSGDEGGLGPDRDDMNMSHVMNSPQGAQVVSDEAGNLRILVRKTKPLLGIAIEGGANTRHPLPRIININENGAAYDAGGLQVGQLILEVDGHKVEGMHHQEVARLIAESFAQRDKPHIEFLVVEAKKSNLEPKPTALIFLEA